MQGVMPLLGPATVPRVLGPPGGDPILVIEHRLRVDFGVEQSKA
jgi:hypothetical protein